MPDFMPMLTANAPAILGVLLFVGVIQFVAFVARRWKSMK